MHVDEVVRWLKIFLVSFIVVAAARAGFEEYGLGGVKSYASVALSAGLVAVVIATAQWVLNPRPRNRAAPASPPAVPAPSLPSAPAPLLPVMMSEPAAPPFVAPPAPKARPSFSKKKASKKSAGKKKNSRRR